MYSSLSLMGLASSRVLADPTSSNIVFLFEKSSDLVFGGQNTDDYRQIWFSTNVSTASGYDGLKKAVSRNARHGSHIANISNVGGGKTSYFAE